MKAKYRFHQAKLRALLAVALLSTPLVQADSEEQYFYEVEIKSLQFWATKQASIVAEHCDQNEQCKDIVGRVDENTVFMQSGEQISFQQARKLDWATAIMSVDKFDRVISLQHYSQQTAVTPGSASL